MCHAVAVIDRQLRLVGGFLLTRSGSGADPGPDPNLHSGIVLSADRVERLSHELVRVTHLQRYSERCAA